MTPLQETNPGRRITGPHPRRMTLLAAFQTAVAAHTQHLDDTDLDHALRVALQAIRAMAYAPPDGGPK